LFCSYMLLHYLYINVCLMLYITDLFPRNAHAVVICQIKATYLLTYLLFALLIYVIS